MGGLSGSKWRVDPWSIQRFAENDPTKRWTAQTCQQLFYSFGGYFQVGHNVLKLCFLNTFNALLILRRFIVRISCLVNDYYIPVLQDRQAPLCTTNTKCFIETGVVCRFPDGQTGGRQVQYASMGQLFKQWCCLWFHSSSVHEASCSGCPQNIYASNWNIFLDYHIIALFNWLALSFTYYDWIANHEAWPRPMYFKKCFTNDDTRYY